MVRVVEYVREKVIVHVGNQLRRHGIVGGVQTEPDSSLSQQNLNAASPSFPS